jgi:hypothetical protein
LGIELLLVHISLLKLSDQGMITLPHQEVQLGLVLLQLQLMLCHAGYVEEAMLYGHLHSEASQ